MNRPLAVQLELLTHLLGRPRGVPDVRLSQVVLDVFVTDNSDPISMFGDEMGERRRGTLAVERVASIRKKYENDPTRLEDPVDFVDLRERIGEVLEQVARDHEVLARVSEGGEAVDIEVGDDVGLGERRPGLEVGEQREVLLGLPSIHVPDRNARKRDRHRVMTRTELHTGSVEKTREQPSRRRAHGSEVLHAAGILASG